ncbi:6-bladed beta-propeller [uncultured Roseivirga sp.]|uniref:6-bladed beta-propeller n=1 Tax=uncultured Roseivirga sp. TaxID=543088 RepID=UPI0030D87B2A|tara:strand:+ start:256728 stop:257864 length:1137 start_codon:yes stop_codon:yes gene_type:complete
MIQNKNIIKVSLLIFSLMINGCQPKSEVDENIIKISVSPASADIILIKDVFPDYRALNIEMPDSVFFGNIEQIKSDNKRVYLLDPFQTKTLTILDKEGKFINQLKRVGKGPGEYSSPYAFAVDEVADELIIYDRGKLEFLTYKLPSLEFVKSKKVNALLMNFELLDKDHFLVTRDDSKNKSLLYGLEIWSREYEVKKDQISDMRNAVIELSYHSTIGQSDNNILYAHPFTGVISTVNPSGLKQEFDLDFEEWEVPEDLYEMDEATRFEEALTRNKYVLWTRFPLKFNNKLTFWYMYGSDIDTYHLLVYDLNSSKYQSYSEILFEDSSFKVPMPLGTDNDQYVSLVWPENIDTENIPENMRTIFQNSLNSELPILLYLK